MPIPTRPVSGAAIASEWGDAVHDQVFSPKASDCGGASTSVLNTFSPFLLDMSVATDDPGGWLDAANDRQVVPTDADGLYTWFCRADSSVGVDGQHIRIYLFLNGAEFTRFQSDCDTGSTITISGMCHIDLVAGDVLTVYAAKKGSGADPHVGLITSSVIRHGYERGA